MRSTFCAPFVVVALISCSLAPARAHSPAPSPDAAPIALDATHFVLVRGDRIVVYEVNPRKGYDLRVLNTALLDEHGMIIGQFRPEARPASAPSAPSTGPAPPPSPAPAAPPVAPEHVPQSAHNPRARPIGHGNAALAANVGAEARLLLLLLSPPLTRQCVIRAGPAKQREGATPPSAPPEE